MQRWVGHSYDDTDWDIYTQRIMCDGSLPGSSTSTITVVAPNGGEKWQVGSSQDIKWTGSGIDGYDVKIEYSTNYGASYTFENYQTNSGISGSYTWTVPDAPSTQCVIRLSVLLSSEISDVSDAVFEISSSGTGTAPAAPGNCAATLTAPTTVEITWKDNSNNEDVFHLERKEGTGGAWSEIGVLSANTTTYNDPGLEPATNYCYRVRAKNSIGFSGYSNESCVSTTSGSNTGTGSNIVVDLGEGAFITFENITAEGNTILSKISSGPEPPEQHVVIPLLNPVFYDITTTATYSGKIHLELPYDPSGIEPEKEAGLQIFHFIEDQSKWLGITTFVDIDNNIVFGETDKLSTFAIMMQSVNIQPSTIVTNTNDSGPGSLRDAILAANANPGFDEIMFNLDPGIPGHDNDMGVWTIELVTELPVITNDGLIIAGFTQTEYGGDTNPDGPEIQISGVNAGEYASGFNIKANDVTILSMIINSFLGGRGIDIRKSTNVQVSGCYIGCSADANMAEANGTGIYIGEESSNIRVTPIDDHRNIISGNKYDGITISDTSSYNFIIENIIGLNRTELDTIGNANSGISISLYSNNNEIIGNHISGNKFGIVISGSKENSVIENWIGTNANFELEAGNRYDGVYIVDNAQHSFIEANIIGHNGTNGIYVLGPATLYNRLERNRISRNAQYGISTSNGGNAELAPPVITDVTTSSVSGTSVPNSRVQIYSDPGNQGAFFEGETGTDASGNFTWNGTPAGIHDNVTAITIDALGNTSQFSFSKTTNVFDKNETMIPTKLELSQNYPNPFNPETVIKFSLPMNNNNKMLVSLRIYNTQGQLICDLVNEEKTPGNHEVMWDGRNNNGVKVTTGIYMYTIIAGDFKDSKKMLYMK